MSDPDSRSPQPPPDSTYIDYETFLSPSFSPYAFAHSLVQSTHDASDTTLTLTTPLSRVLFDLQEIDTHIHNLTSTSALPLLTYTSTTTDLTSSTISEIESQLSTLTATYARLTTSITTKSNTATEILTATENLHSTTTLLRDISRALVAARQLDQNLTDNALLRAAQSLRDLREALPESSSTPQPRIVTELRTLILRPGETEVSKRATAELLNGGALALYVISPTMCTNAVRDYLRGSIQSSTSALVRALTSITLLERAVGEVVVFRNGVTRLQESLVDAGLGEVVNGIVEGGAGDLRSVFFGGVAEGMEAGVQDVVRRGGANARILKGARDRVRQALRACVERDWEGGKGGFESAVMVGAAAALGR